MSLKHHLRHKQMPHLPSCHTINMSRVLYLVDSIETFQSRPVGDRCKKCEKALKREIDDTLDDFNYVGSRHHY